MNDSTNKDIEYDGVDNLEAMTHAHNYNKFLVDLVLSHISNSEVVDFGAGAGTFAKMLRARGVKVTCIEPDPTLRTGLVSDRFDSFASIDDMPTNSIESLYTLNVLEHIEDDQATMSELAAKLQNKGRAVIYVPAFNVLYSSMDRSVGHFRRYRRSELVNKLTIAGLVVERAEYIDSLGFLASLVFRFIGNESGDINARQVSFYDRWIFPLSRVLDRLLLGSIGKNLLVVVSKR